MGCGPSSPAVTANAKTARNNAKQAAIAKPPQAKIKDSKQAKTKKEEEEEEEEELALEGLMVPQIMIRGPTAPRQKRPIKEEENPLAPGKDPNKGPIKIDPRSNNVVVKSAPKEPELAEVSVASTEKKESASKEELSSFSSSSPAIEDNHAEAKQATFQVEASAPVPENKPTEAEPHVEASAPEPVNQPIEVKQAESHVEASVPVQENQPIEVKQAESHVEASVPVQENQPIEAKQAASHVEASVPVPETEVKQTESHLEAVPVNQPTEEKQVESHVEASVPVPETEVKQVESHVEAVPVNQPAEVKQVESHVEAVPENKSTEVKQVESHTEVSALVPENKSTEAESHVEPATVNQPFEEKQVESHVEASVPVPETEVKQTESHVEAVPVNQPTEVKQAGDDSQKSDDYEILNWNAVDISKDHPEFAATSEPDQSQETTKEPEPTIISTENVVTDVKTTEVAPLETVPIKSIESVHDDMEILNWENVDLSKPRQDSEPFKITDIAKNAPIYVPPKSGSKSNSLDNLTEKKMGAKVISRVQLIEIPFKEEGNIEEVLTTTQNPIFAEPLSLESESFSEAISFHADPQTHSVSHTHPVETAPDAAGTDSSIA